MCFCVLPHENPHSLDDLLRQGTPRDVLGRVNLHVGLQVIVPAINSSLSVRPQSHDARFEVRGRHGKSVLTISGIRLSDLGRFDCEALSRIGGHQKSMFLDIERKYHRRSVLFSPQLFPFLLPGLGKAAKAAVS